MCRPAGLIPPNNANPGLTSWATIVSPCGLRMALGDGHNSPRVPSGTAPLRHQRQNPCTVLPDSAHLITSTQDLRPGLRLCRPSGSVLRQRPIHHYCMPAPILTSTKNLRSIKRYPRFVQQGHKLFFETTSPMMLRLVLNVMPHSIYIRRAPTTVVSSQLSVNSRSLDSVRRGRLRSG